LKTLEEKDNGEKSGCELEKGDDDGRKNLL